MCLRVPLVTRYAHPLAAERTRLRAAENAVIEARRALVVAALEATHGNRARAAALLGHSHPRTLARWIVDLDLVARLDALALERGWATGDAPAAHALRGRLEARRPAGPTCDGPPCTCGAGRPR